MTSRRLAPAASWPWLYGVFQDLRFAVRLLLKSRGFTAIAVLALALGIGVSTSIFALVNALLYRGILLDEPDRILHVGTVGASDQTGLATVSYLDYQDWQTARTLDRLAAHSDATMNVSEDGHAPARFLGTYISAHGFRLLGVRPVLGRDFLPADDVVGALPVAILSHDVWQSRYDGAPQVIGRTVRINEVPTTIVGVMAEGIKFPLATDLWQPLAMLPGLTTQPRDARTLLAVGRLAEGVSLTEAQEEIGAIAARLSREHPGTNEGIRAEVVRLHDWYMPAAAVQVMVVLLGTIGFVLLIACANVANLLLARAAHRSPEIATRVAVGAPRARLVQQLLVESLVLAILAGVVGFAFSLLGIHLLSLALAPTNPPYWVQLTLDGRVFTVLALTSFATAVLFGLVPAFEMSKTNVREVLQEGGRSGGPGVRARRWASALVMVTLTLTLVLLGGAGVMMRSFLALYTLDVGVETKGVTMVRLELPALKYETPEQRIRFYQRLEERLGAIPTFAGATLASAAPGIGGAANGLAIEGRTDAGGVSPMVSVITIGDDYFQALDLPLLHGRAFAGDDGRPGRERVIVNERFASMYFPSADPSGHRIRVTAGSENAAPWATIIGVAPTVRQGSLRQREAEPVVYLPYRAQPMDATTLLVRGAEDAGTIAGQIRAELRTIDPDLPVFDVQTLDQLLAFYRWQQRLLAGVFVALAGIALLVSAMGLYGVTAHAVIQRTREIGVRVALGAQAPQVVWCFMRGLLIQLAFGVALGLAGAYYIAQLMEVFILHASPADPITLALVVVLLVVVALVACLVPALRATRLNPVTALRYE